MTNGFFNYCDHKRPATVTLGNSGFILESRFSEITPDGVALDLLSPPEGLEIPPSTQCTVIYNSGMRTTFFVSRSVRFASLAEPLPQLILALPDHERLAESRRTFRIPIQEGSSLNVTVRLGDQTWRPRPVDFSLGGILVEFEDQAPPFTVEDELEVILEFGVHNASLEGFAGRGDGRGCVIYFAEALRELRKGPMVVPTVLKKIFSGLESENWDQ
jgi:c-di-GMP-binding flagellar brake protein YcgR